MTETNKWTTCKTVCLGLVKWKESHLQSSKQNNKRGTGVGMWGLNNNINFNESELQSVHSTAFHRGPQYKYQLKYK